MNSYFQGHQPRQGPEEPDQKVMVRDWSVRLFHWLLIVAVAVGGVTGFLASDNWLDVHVIAGYALAILISFRLIWGMAGSRYSRFSSFPLSGSALRKHLRNLASGQSRDHIGHNPAGAWMIVLLLMVLVALTLTGLVVLGGQEKLGPLAFVMSFQAGHQAAELHEIAAWVLVAAIVIHLAGVFVETVVFRHAVIKAMVTGKKTVSDPVHTATGRGYALRGNILLAAATVILLSVGAVLSDIPPLGWTSLEMPVVYTSECGDCHDPYHPGLRTGSAWQSMMTGLSDHYGEDASLEVETAAAIHRYLTANPAGRFDTEAAHRIGRVETPSLRMTDTPYWKRRHEDIAIPVYRQSNIGSKVNCNACHSDALTGRFDDSKIKIPDGGKK